MRLEIIHKEILAGYIFTISKRIDLGEVDYVVEKFSDRGKFLESRYSMNLIFLYDWIWDHDLETVNEVMQVIQ